MTPKTISKVTAATAALAVAAIMMTSSADAGSNRIRYECRANGLSDISMKARYEILERRRVRRKFTTEFEAGPRADFSKGDKLAVVVDDVRVGSMTLEQLVGGDLVGDLNFDTRRQRDAGPFPADWPDNVGRGSTIDLAVGGKVVLGCELR